MTAADRLRALHQAATPVDWGIDGSDADHWGIRTKAGDQRIVAVMADGWRGDNALREDADLMITLRNALPELIALVEAAQKTLLPDPARYGPVRLRAPLAALEAKLGGEQA